MTEIKMFHPTYTYIKKTVRNFDAVPLLVDIFKDGKLIYNLPSLTEIQDYARKELTSCGMSTSACSIRNIIQWIWRVMYGKTRWT